GVRGGEAECGSRRDIPRAVGLDRGADSLREGESGRLRSPPLVLRRLEEGPGRGLASRQQAADTRRPGPNDDAAGKRADSAEICWSIARHWAKMCAIRPHETPNLLRGRLSK